VDGLSYIPAVSTLALIVPAAVLGRRLARLLRQPEIVGEIMASLLLGWILAAQLDWRPHDFTGWSLLEKAGHLGLALFLVGAVHEIRSGAGQLRGRTVAFTAAGSALLPLGCGALLAVWVLRYGGPHLRGSAPTSAFVLMLGVSLAVTAVPVLAGILADRELLHTPIGRLSMAVAVAIDAVTWMLLAVAVSLAAGGGRTDPYTAFAVGLLLAWAVRRAGGTAAARAWAARVPRTVPLALTAGAAVAAVLITARLGLTDVLGALLIALALPSDEGRGAWTGAARTVGGWGRVALPLLFTTTGMSLGAAPLGDFSWQAVVLALALAVGAKLTGSYLGARAAGRPPATSMRLAALLNVRGLTEIAALQTGYQAGILTPALFLALFIMALVTTALSGPLLWLIGRYAPEEDPLTAEAPPLRPAGIGDRPRHLKAL